MKLHNTTDVVEWCASCYEYGFVMFCVCVYVYVLIFDDMDVYRCSNVGQLRAIN